MFCQAGKRGTSLDATELSFVRLLEGAPLLAKVREKWATLWILTL